MGKMLVIDGGYGEGGGQILRTSLALSVILGRPIRIENIRSKRSRPGLQPQHLTSARAAAAICGGRLVGGSVGSQLLELHPGEIAAGNYFFDVSEIKPSAGSVNLIFQTVVLPLLFAGKKSRVTIKGGTHVPMSPSANFIDEVYLPVLARMGGLVHYRMVRAGYYPIGGGEIQAEILPAERIHPIDLTERPEGDVTVYSAVSNLPESIAERQMAEAVGVLKGLGVRPVEVIDDYPSLGKGTVAFILFSGGQVKSGFTSLGERGKPAEKVAREAALEFADWHRSGQAIDKHLADQLILPMAIASGESSFTTSEVTQHLLTNVWTVRQFLPVEIEVRGEVGEAGSVLVKFSA